MTDRLPHRAGIYCRLSYAPDGSVEKVERQEGDCRELATRLRWPLSEAHVYVDNSRSAWQRTRRRPAWEAMLTALEQGEIDSIIVYHGDRLIRQPYDLEKLLSIAESKGIRLASPSGVRDLDNPDDRFILRIEVAQACRESDNTSRRVKRHLKARAEKGLTQVGGSRPFGFGVQVGARTATDPETGESVLVPIYDTAVHMPGEAALLKEAVARLLAGQRQIGVVKWLNTKSTTTEGNPWTTKTFRDLLLRPRIAGLIERDGVLLEAAWDGIISVEQWQDVKALYQRGAEKHPYAGRDRKYLLSTIAECGGCEGVMRGRPVGGKDKPRRRTRYTQYYCPGCKKVSRKTDTVDGYVQGKVLRLLQDERFAVEFRAAAGAGAPGISAQIAELEERKRNHVARLDELADDPDLDPVLTMRALASFDRKLAALRAQLGASAAHRAVERCLGMTREEWLDEPVDVRSTVVRSLFRVVILPTSRRGPGFDPESVRMIRCPLAGSEG